MSFQWGDSGPGETAAGVVCIVIFCFRHSCAVISPPIYRGYHRHRSPVGDERNATVTITNSWKQAQIRQDHRIIQWASRQQRYRQIAKPADRCDTPLCMSDSLSSRKRFPGSQQTTSIWSRRFGWCTTRPPLAFMALGSLWTGHAVFAGSVRNHIYVAFVHPLKVSDGKESQKT